MQNLPTNCSRFTTLSRKITSFHNFQINLMIECQTNVKWGLIWETTFGGTKNWEWAEQVEWHNYPHFQPILMTRSAQGLGVPSKGPWKKSFSLREKGLQLVICPIVHNKEICFWHIIIGWKTHANDQNIRRHLSAEV